MPKSKKFRIGLRWQGNPQFEHEQHRHVSRRSICSTRSRVLDAEFVSLQRDEGAEHKPEWVKEVILAHWEDTRQAIASCDLVVSSCTSVAHMSAAMGVPTWIVMPVLPYYLWAKPGIQDGVVRFSAVVPSTGHGDWVTAFVKIKQDLKKEFKMPTKTGYWIRVKNGKVTDVWDYKPSAEKLATEGGWREAVEVLPDLVAETARS